MSLKHINYLIASSFSQLATENLFEHFFLGMVAKSSEGQRLLLLLDDYYY